MTLMGFPDIPPEVLKEKVKITKGFALGLAEC